MPSARGASDHFDLDFRPASYFVRADSASVALQHIRGDIRREMARRAFAAGRRLDPRLCTPNGSSDFQHGIGWEDPGSMGGEYLPDYDAGEVEIARIVLASVTRDVYSVRALWVGEELRHRIVDEYETDWHLTREASARPLSMGELIELIDRATFSGNSWEDLTDALRDGARGDDGDPADSANFVSVTSELYPQLGCYYAAKAVAWLEARREAFPPARVRSAHHAPFDDGSFYRHRHLERVARARELADGAPPGSSPELREALVREGERGRWLTHDDLRRLLLRPTDGRGEHRVRPRRR